MAALQMVMLGDEDPVPNKENVVYRIRVWNEGDAVAENVQLDVELPEGLSFEDAEAPTEFSENGSTVSFDVIKRIAPGEQHDFIVTATSKGSGNVRAKAKLSSKSLVNPVTAAEPTRLFSEKQANNQ